MRFSGRQLRVFAMVSTWYAMPEPVVHRATDAAVTEIPKGAERHFGKTHAVGHHSVPLRMREHANPYNLHAFAL